MLVEALYYAFKAVDGVAQDAGLDGRLGNEGRASGGKKTRQSVEIRMQRG